MLLSLFARPVESDNVPVLLTHTRRHQTGETVNKQENTKKKKEGHDR